MILEACCGVHKTDGQLVFTDTSAKSLWFNVGPASQTVAQH